jgi:hypothetical protein
VSYIYLSDTYNTMTTPVDQIPAVAPMVSPAVDPVAPTEIVYAPEIVKQVEDLRKHFISPEAADFFFHYGAKNGGRGM